jgi:hypothetical protein
VSEFRFRHALVIGGSGMLAECCRKLLAISGKVSVMARGEERVRAIASQIVPLLCDYNDMAAVTSALEGQTPDLVVAWVHSAALPLRRMLAERVPPGGRFVQVVGSGHGDPSRAALLEEKKTVTAGLPITGQIVVLGFVVEGAGSRWLTDSEISDGTFAAIESGDPHTIIGTATPVSLTPNLS